MKTRATELRERNRRVFVWSLGIAVLLHGAVFLLWPAFRSEPLNDFEVRVLPERGGEGSPLFVDASFGPPDISEGDGTHSREPPERVLQADRIMRLPPDCESLVATGGGPVHGRVRLRVKPSGRVDVVEVTQSTGDACGDVVIETLAADLWYRWLPSERFPAPVDLIQPITLADVWD